MLEVLPRGNKIIAMTHGEDLDGLFSAAILHQAIPEEIELRFSAPYEIRYSESEYDVVMDLPPPKGGCTVLVDHHISNLELLDRVRYPILRPEYPSTAQLLYEVLRDEEPAIKRLEVSLDLVNNMDTGVVDVNGALFTSAVRRLFKEERRRLIRVVMDLVRSPPRTSRDLIGFPSIRKDIAVIRESIWEIIESKIPEKEGLEGLIVMLRSVPAYAVPLVTLWADRFKFFGSVTKGSDGALRLSLRSRPDSPLSALEVAERLGGGGHERAAGALIMPAMMEELLSMLKETLEVEVIEI